jgi:hypothetical protein
MQWRYDSQIQEHQLAYNKTILARIQVTPLKRGGMKVVTMVSGIYFGRKTQEELEHQKKQWIACRKKYKDKDSANQYIARKKEAVLRFILAREKEG